MDIKVLSIDCEPIEKTDLNRNTRLRSFKREGHDSSRFYSRKLYRQNTTNNGESNCDGKYGENQIEIQNLNKLFCKSSEKMDELPEYSVHLMVISPPYNVGKDYDQDLSVKEYRSLLKQVFKETFRVLVHGGRAYASTLQI